MPGRYVVSRIICLTARRLHLVFDPFCCTSGFPYPDEDDVGCRRYVYARGKPDIQKGLQGMVQRSHLSILGQLCSDAHAYALHTSKLPMLHHTCIRVRQMRLTYFAYIESIHSHAQILQSLSSPVMFTMSRKYAM